jgi:hypothetical protein
MADLGKPCLVDTNVGVAANFKSDASDECALTCIQTLREITERGHLVLDTIGLIFDEYRKNMSMSGQPGVGDVFMRWVNDNQYNTERCTRVAVTPENGSFEEFPPDTNLADFDLSDRKFVAVAAAHGGKPPILVACDTDFWIARDALAAANIQVEFLCPIDIETMAERHGA